jgi:transcriptional regulator with XRE-family HTH domain
VEAVRELREVLGYSQARLAALCGLHSVTVYRWERGHLEPSPEVARLLDGVRLAVALDPSLPGRLRRIGADPLRELALILSTLHPDLAAEGLASRADADALFARARAGR